METQEIKRIVEALILAADEPLSGARILETLELKNGFDLETVIAELNREYRENGRSFLIRQVAGGYQIATQPQYANWIRKLYLGRQKTRLSQAALETLALVAFKQPVSRVEIAQIRGVNSDGVIGTLLERKLITISGRSEGVGRPLLYGTTPEFLKYFGLNDLSDLPKPREIEELFGKEGMPEELIQVLSQTEAQLSLPIHADGEAPSIAEDIESKVEAKNLAEQVSLSELPLETAASSVGASDERPSSHSVDSATLSNNVPQDDEIPSGSQPSENESEPSLPLVVDEESGFSLDEPGESEPLVDNRNEIPPENLAAGVEELFGASKESQPAAMEIGDSPIIVGSEEIAAVSLPVPDETQADGKTPLFFSARHNRFANTPETFAEEFFHEDIAEPDFLLKTDDLILDDLRKMPVNAPQSPDSNGKASAARDDALGPAPIPSPSSVSGGIFQNSEQSLAAELMIATNVPAEDEVIKDSLASLRTDETPHTPLDDEATGMPNRGNRRLTFREKAAGWIKRAFHKLMTLVGARSDSSDYK